MKLYAYCLCADLETFDKPVTGVSGAEVRVLKVDDLSLLVSDCEAVSPTQENALAHAAVVRSVFEQTTPMPFRFGTVATEQQLRSYITNHKLALANRLSHLRGCAEMDLKINWQRPQASSPPSNQRAEGPGTAFLREKRRELLGDERTAAPRAELSELLRTGLDPLVKEEKIELQPSETVVLAKVYHLIERPKIQEYRNKIEEIPRNQPELEVRVSGPWPPYSFANIELEFKSHFGVS